MGHTCSKKDQAKNYTWKTVTGILDQILVFLYGTEHNMPEEP